MIIDATLGAVVQQIPIAFTTSGDNIVVQGLVGKQIKVLQFFYTVSGSTIIVFKSYTSPGVTASLSGLVTFAGNGSQVQDYMQLPLTCRVGDSYVMNSSAAVTVGGTLWYVMI